MYCVSDINFLYDCNMTLNDTIIDCFLDEQAKNGEEEKEKEKEEKDRLAYEEDFLAYEDEMEKMRAIPSETPITYQYTKKTKVTKAIKAIKAIKATKAKRK